jgi:hypothetical protein
MALIQAIDALFTRSLALLSHLTATAPIDFFFLLRLLKLFVTHNLLSSSFYLCYCRSARYPMPRAPSRRKGSDRSVVLRDGLFDGQTCGQIFETDGPVGPVSVRQPIFDGRITACSGLVKVKYRSIRFQIDSL